MKTIYSLRLLVRRKALTRLHLTSSLGIPGIAYSSILQCEHYLLQPIARSIEPWAITATTTNFHKANNTGGDIITTACLLPLLLPFSKRDAPLATAIKSSILATTRSLLLFGPRDQHGLPSPQGGTYTQPTLSLVSTRSNSRVETITDITSISLMAARAAYTINTEAKRKCQIRHCIALRRNKATQAILRRLHTRNTTLRGFIQVNQLQSHHIFSHLLTDLCRRLLPPLSFQ